MESLSASIHFLLLLLSVIFYFETIKLGFCHGDVKVGCIDAEREALLNFKKRLTDPLGQLSSWVGTDCCRWRGVSCNNTTGNVVHLKLRKPYHPYIYDVDGTVLALGGEIDPSLAQLKYLSFLDLSMNNFGGTQFPNFIGSFENLRYLNLSGASFGGSIPPNLGNLSKMLYLDLNFMRHLDLNSMIQSNVSDLRWLSGLSSLKYLNLGGVGLSKVAESWLQTVNMLPNLVELHLPNCGLSNLPVSLPFVNLTSLSLLDLSKNGFNSTLPHWLFNLSSLSHLDLNSNNIQGDLPDVLANLVSLQSLDLSSNLFEGPLPLWSSNVTKLYLRDNLFTGPIPTDIGEVMPFLTNLDISRNSLNGSIPLSIGNLTSLATLDMSSNLLSGEIPHFWTNMPDLSFVDVSNNNLFGTIPQSMGALSSLEFLILSSNNLSGELPPSLRNCTKMSFFYLGDNTFSGNLPAWIGENMPSLLIISLRYNLFSGSIPSQICTLSALHILDLSHNNLDGFIPPCLWNVKGMRSELSDIYKERYEGRLNVVPKGSIMVNYSTLYLLNMIDLSHNNLLGEIPREGLTYFPKLRCLNLSMNHLTGTIPAEIENLEWLEALDLSRNHLSGEIPPSLASLIFLSCLNLSYNDLSGEIPRGNQLETFETSIYDGNLRLCGYPLPTECSPQSLGGDGEDEDGEDRDKYDELWLSLSILLGFTVGFWGVCGTLVIKKSWRKAYFCFFDELKDKIHAHLQKKLG